VSSISVKITSKHQITIPSAIRKELDLEAGDRLLAQVRDGVIVLGRYEEARSTSFAGFTVTSGKVTFRPTWTKSATPGNAQLHLKFMRGFSRSRPHFVT